MLHIVERVVVKRFVSRANTFGLLSTHQSAYRQHHSAETAILSVHNDLVRVVDDGKVTILVLPDFSAAFDTVDHDILLSVIRVRFLANVNSRSRLLYAIARPSVCLSVFRRLSSVTFVCPTQAVQIFGNISAAVIYKV